VSCTYHAICACVSVLDVLRLLNWVLPDDFNPITVRVQNEGDMAHASIGELLLELVTRILEPRAGSLYVIYRHAEMPEALVRFRVAVGNLVVWIVFGAVVVSELDNALAVGPVIAVGHCLGAVVCEEVEVELGVRVLDLIDHFHAEEFIELDTPLRVLNAKPACGQLLTNTWIGAHSGTYME
jgi:hypothetical protein